MSLAKRGNLGENVTFQWKFSYRGGGGDSTQSLLGGVFPNFTEFFYRKRSEIMHIFIEIASQLIKSPNYPSPILKVSQVYLTWRCWAPRCCTWSACCRRTPRTSPPWQSSLLTSSPSRFPQSCSLNLIIIDVNMIFSLYVKVITNHHNKHQQHISTQGGRIGSLSVRAKMATKVFVRCGFAIFATNASL